MGRIAGALVAALAFVLAFHKLDDFDTWWHLASGRWIAAHRAVPAADTLSHTVRDHAWVNLQWGFDLGLYLLHRAGGPILLCISGALAFLSTVALLLRLATRRVPAAFAALLLLIVILAAQERVTVRPELLSFLLLAIVLTILDVARRDDGRWAFVLVPVMLVWVNTHALFVVGIFAIVCGLIGSGTKPPKKLLLWAGAAIAVVLVNPYGSTGVVFPLKLVSRINGSSAAFRTVGEFMSPWAPGAAGLSIVFYKLVLALAGVLALVAIFSKRRQAPRFDWGGLVFVAGLVALSIGARRNIALFALGAAPFMAHCLQVILAARPTRLARRGSGLVAGLVGVAAVVIAGGVISGAFYKLDNSPQEFGAGVIEGAFPTRAVAFARAAALPGRLYNDMAAGGYLTWDDPIGDGVFVDGRLEVYDTSFITDYVTAVASPVRWQADANRFGIQTVIIFHRFENDRMLAGRLAQDPLWSLVYHDEVAAIFVRHEGNLDAIARAAAIRPEWDARTQAWLDRPAKKWPYPAGRIEGTRAYARFSATIGRAEPAVAAYLRLVELGIPSAEEIERRLLLMRYFSSNGRAAEAREQARKILVVDPANAEAQRLGR